ncbi:hypothetical protein DV735_g26, partial [Chaetothyriales sp. CBS 134920]
MSLPTVDHATSAGDSPSYGIHHRIALLACRVIAGNAFENSYLALDRAGQERVEAQDEDVLTEQEYYFIVEGNVKPFVIAGRARYVIRLYEESGNCEYKTEECSGEKLRNLYGGGGSKTATPMNKRKCGAEGAADDEDEAEGSDEDSDLSMEEAAHFWGETCDRKRRRNQDSSEETAPEVDPDTKAHLAPDVEAELRDALWKGVPVQEDYSDEEVDMPLRLK